MKIALAKKLKEQRKTKKMTIAEILSRSNINMNHTGNHMRQRSAIPNLNGDSSNQNPNEPNDELINLEIRPMSLEQQNQII